MHPTVRRSATTALFAAFAVAGAHAASFDCKSAKTPTEKSICGSPKLSALDERLASEYERALHALSPAGAAQLKASQRSWLHYATRVCTPRAANRHGEPPGECLENAYGLRVDQLALAGVRVGPYVFNRVDFYAATPVKGDDGAAVNAGFVTDHVAFAQIDAPANAPASAWNAAQRSADPGPIVVSDDPNEILEDDDTDYTLGCAGDRFVSLQVNGTELQHGVAHPSYNHEVRNMLLVPTLRKMTANDIFAAGAPWKARLPALFWSVYTRDPDAGKDVASIEEAIKASAANPERWLLTPHGLQISFDADEAGCYACDPGPITVPWSAIKPMLAAPDLAACKAPPAAKP